MPGRLAQLSIAALRMAAAGAGARAESSLIARWLYRFGTVPRTPPVERDFGNDDEPMAVLGLTVGGRARRALETAFEAASFGGWISFSRASPPAEFRSVCKLYISPRPEALAQAFPAIVTEMARFEVPSFKVGRGIEGLLRPDKIVAYFADRTHMEDVSKALAHTLRNCPAQGVPFTAEAGCDGLLSTGVDPVGRNAAVSWRSWITNELALALAAAQEASRADRVTAALEHIRKSGVDPCSWTLADASSPGPGLT
jgi:hypothetical protein